MGTTGRPVSRAASPGGEECNTTPPTATLPEESIIFNVSPADQARGARPNPKPYIPQLLARYLTESGCGYNLLSHVTEACCHSQLNLTPKAFHSRLGEYKPFYELTLALGRGVITLLLPHTIKTYGPALSHTVYIMTNYGL